MKASELMTGAVHCCAPLDTMEHAAQIMWEQDCGAVPVVDEESKVVGVITDRDVCMAAYTQGRPLAALEVAQAMSRGVISCRPEDEIEQALALMSRHQLRRLPVVDGARRLKGMLSLADVVQVLGRDGRTRVKLSDSVVATLIDVTRPRSEVGPAKGTTPTLVPKERTPALPV